MVSRFRSWWPYIRKYWVVTIIIALVAMGVTIFLGYWFNWPWTGFGPETSDPKQHAKTLWDWLNLLGVLAIPAVVGLGAAWYTAQQGKVSDRENIDNQHETALQAYIDNMSELLLHEKLRDSAAEDEVRKIARVRTLTILPRLDANRKRSVLQFLYESGLIEKGKCIVDLSGADLSEANLSYARLREADLSGARLIEANLLLADLGLADLSGANLSYANLSGAKLNGANLSGATLVRAKLGLLADLSGAILNGAEMFGADLGLADLSGARLIGAKLREADLSGARLSGADLSGAGLDLADLKDATDITTEQLDKAKSLQGATMPDGSTHP